MVMLDDFEDLERRVKNLEAEKQRAEGALSSLMARLRKEYGCKTVEEARAKLQELEEAERKAAVRYTKRKKEFEEKYGEVLKK